MWACVNGSAVGVGSQVSGEMLREGVVGVVDDAKRKAMVMTKLGSMVKRYALYRVSRSVA